MALQKERLFARFCRSRAAFGALPSIWRSYSQSPHNKRTPLYHAYNKGLTDLRVKFMREKELERKMMTEDFNSQAAQEARKEKEREARALEENEKELKRMAELREERMARQMLKQEDKRIHGIEVREKVSTDLKERRRLRVAEMIERSKNFVTLENLEEKIEEALSKEANYNFAFSISGKKI